MTTSHLIETFKTETAASFRAANLTERFKHEDAANQAAEKIIDLADSGDAEADKFVGAMLSTVEAIRKAAIA